MRGYIYTHTCNWWNLEMDFVLLICGFKIIRSKILSKSIISQIFLLDQNLQTLNHFVLLIDNVY